MKALNDAYRALTQELDALDQRRGEIEGLLVAMRKVLGVDLEHDDTPAPKKSTAKNARTPAKTKRQGRPRHKTIAAEVPDRERILGLLKKNGPMKPGDLAHALDLTIFALRSRLKLLAKAGELTITGQTIGRRVALPGRSSAKEAL